MSSLREFCKKYPEYCNQELYEKILNKQGNHRPARRGSEARRVYASDIGPGLKDSMVLVEGVAMDVAGAEFARRDGRGAVRVTEFNIYDKTGRVPARVLGDDYLDISDGEIIRAVGRVEEWKGFVRLRVFEIERLGRVEIDQREVEEITTPPSPPPRQASGSGPDAVGKVLALLKSAKEQGKQVYHERLLGLLEKLGIRFEDIEKYVEVKEVARPNSLEKVKVVELKDSPG